MRLTISKKLIGGFMSVAILLVLVSGIASFSLNRVKQSYADLLERQAVLYGNAKDIQYNAAEQVSSLQGYFLKQDPNVLLYVRTANENLADFVTQSLEMVTAAEQKEKLTKLAELNEEFRQKTDEVLAILTSDPQTAMETISNQLVPLGREMETRASQIAAELFERMNEEKKTVNHELDSITAVVLAVSLFAVLMAVILGLIISRKIAKPVLVMAKAAEQIASGDLSGANIQIKSRDEIGDLARSFDKMKGNLRNLIQQVGRSTEQVAAFSEQLQAIAEQTSKASEQIASTVQEVATGSEKQARSVEESAKVIEEMSASIQQIASNAQHVTSAADQASELAAGGNEGVQAAIRQMNHISLTVQGLAEAVKGLGERSKEIGQIVEAITGIAEQTNLLALNAAIEAARAGEQGRGFAVVADEVRKLAEQSAYSAQQIACLIAAIQEETGKVVQSMQNGMEEVTEGIEIVNASGASFERIQKAVNNVTSQIREVSAAARQMSAATDQAVRSIGQIAKIAEVTAEGVQNVSAASEEQLASMEEISVSAASLAKMALELQDAVRRFKV